MLSVRLPFRPFMLHLSPFGLPEKKAFSEKTGPDEVQLVFILRPHITPRQEFKHVGALAFLLKLHLNKNKPFHLNLGHFEASWLQVPQTKGGHGPPQPSQQPESDLRGWKFPTGPARERGRGPVTVTQEKSHQLPFGE